MTEEAQWVALAAQGDTEAFEALVRHHERRVYNTIFRICGHPDDAFDLSQEVFLRVWRHLSSFQGQSAFTTWLYRLCVNVCTDHLRKKSRRPEEPLTDELVFIDNTHEPQAALERAELQRNVQQAMASLSPEHRTILSLREVSGLRYAEIAEILGIEEGTVKSRIARARIQMREELRQSGTIPTGSSSNPKKGSKGG